MSQIAVVESMFLFQYECPERGVTVGGTQRYAFALGHLFCEMGYKVVILSKAKRYFELKYEGMDIIAFPVAFGVKGNKKLSKYVWDYCSKNNVSFVCYSDLLVGAYKPYKKAFALQHGIAWDNPLQIKNYYYAFKEMHAIKHLQKIVCVDTNFINFARFFSKYYFLHPEHLNYIPNFADLSLFNVESNNWQERGMINLLYARRLVNHRGFDIFLKMCSVLIDDGYPIKAVFAFEDFQDATLKKILKNYPNLKFEIVHPNMNDMKSCYMDSFLSFIPTRWSEGTSLSAIESIVMGCPVIASDVGGLGNIIIPEFNGYIVSPSVNSFVSVTKKLINNFPLRNKLSLNCISMREAFSMDRWKTQISSIINTL